MSNLIRGGQEAASAAIDVTPASMPLPHSTLIAHLKTCQSLTRDHLQKGFDVFLKSLVDAYDIEIDRAESNSDATQAMDIQRTIRKSANEMKHFFVASMVEGFTSFSKKKLNTTIDSHRDRSAGDLSIVANDDLEETISITSITQRIDAYFIEPLWALNQRFSMLNNAEPVTESGNPVAPIQFCQALKRSLAAIALPSSAKVTAYKIFDVQLLSLFRLVSEDVNRYLQSQGILPNLKYTIPKGAAPKSYLAEDGDHFGRRAEDHGLVRECLPDHDDTPEQYQADLVSAIRILYSQINNNRLPAMCVGPNDDPVYSQNQLVNAFTQLQLEAPNQLQLSPSTHEALTPIDINDVIAQVKNRLVQEQGAADVKNEDIQTIDLVGMVFEFMLSDENIPDSVKTVLSYLHTPFLKIAFIDPGFFERTEHPARVLLNNLADAGARWVSNDGTSQFNMYVQIKDIVNRVLTEFEKDVKVITSLLFEFNGYVKTVSRKQELTEKRAKEKAEGEDKLRQMKMRVNEEVQSRIQDRELPSAVLLLFLQPWSDYLTFILLRYGDESQLWAKGLELIGNVLWCIQPKKSDEDKAKCKQKAQEVLSGLDAGFDVISFDSFKAGNLKSAFMSLCELAEKSKRAKPASEPMRSQLERIAAEKAGHNVHDCQEMLEEEAQMVESLKMIEFGTWFEFDGGKRLKVAWYNGRTSHYMLVDQMGKRVDMQSGLALARKMILGEARIISGSSKPFFERALENIYRKLNEHAETIPEGPSNA